MRSAIVLATLLLASVGIWAQPDPNDVRPHAPGREVENRGPAFPYMGILTRAQTTQVAATAQGVFILRNGTLAKYEGRMQQPPMQLELHGVMPPVPAANAPETEWYAFAMAEVKRRLPARLIAQNTDIFVATNDQLWHIDGVTLAVKAKIPLGTQEQCERFYNQPEPPQLEVFGTMAYLVRSNEFLRVDLTAGIVLFKNILPAGTVNTGATGQIFRHYRAGAAPVKQPERGAEHTPRVTVLGVIRRVNVEGGFWAVEARNGQKYVLEGEKLPALAALPKIEGARVRLTGTITNRPGIVQYGNGYFTILEYELLDAEKPGK